MIDTRPARLSALGSLLVGLLSIALVATAATQQEALAVGGVGIAALAVGVWWSEGRFVTGLFALVGIGFLVAALGIVMVRPVPPGGRAEVVPGLIGVSLFVAALAPIRAGWERYLLAVGTGLLFLTVLVSGAIRGASTLQLLAAGAAVVLAWDVGEQAVNVSEQVGTSAATARVEAVHGGSTALVGAVGVALALAVHRLGFGDVPLSGLLLLLGGGITLLVVLYN